MGTPKPPCIDCDDRSEGCHARCEGYKEFRKMMDEHKETLREIKGKKYNLDSYYVAKKKRRGR